MNIGAMRESELNDKLKIYVGKVVMYLIGQEDTEAENRRRQYSMFL